MIRKVPELRSFDLTRREILDGEQTVNSLQTAPTVGSIDLDAVINQPGWTHLQHELDALQPDKILGYDIWFPNDYAIQGQGRLQVGERVAT